MAAEWHLSRVRPDYALASYRDCFICIWRHETTMEGTGAVRRETLGFGETRPKGIALLTIVEEGAPMPPTEARQSLAHFMRDASDHIKVSGVVFEGTGFRAAAVRSVVVGLTMLARQKYPHKVFGNLSETAEWMAAELGGRLENSFSAHELEQAVNELRAQIDGDSDHT